MKLLGIYREFGSNSTTLRFYTIINFVHFVSIGGVSFISDLLDNSSGVLQ